MVHLSEFFNQGWLAENHEADFVKRFRNAASQLELQLEFGGLPGSGKKDALGTTDDEKWETIKFQFQQAKEEAEKLEGTDKEAAEEALEKFREHYKEYMVYLE